MAMTADTNPDRPSGGPATYSGTRLPNGAIAASTPGGGLVYLNPAQDPSGQNVYWGPQSQQGQQGQQGQGPPQYGQMRTPGSPQYGQVFQGAQGAPQGAQQVYQGNDGNYYTTYNSGTGWTGVARVGPNPWQAPPQPQQQQAPQGLSSDQLQSILSQITPSTAATGQSASPTGLTASAVPGGQATTTQATPTATIPSATNPTGSMYNLGASFQQPQQQQPQQYRSGGRVQGYQGGGQVSNPSNPYQYQTSTDWFNPEFSMSELGASALGVPGYGSPVVIGPMPNQGQMGQGSMGPSGVYAGPQRSTVLGQGTGGGLGQTYTPSGPWNYQPGVLSGPAGSKTIGMQLPGGAGTLSPQSSLQISSLQQAYQSGNADAGVALEQLRGAMGLSVDQFHSMTQKYTNDLQGVYTQAYPGGTPSWMGAGAPQANPLTATPWGTGTGTTGGPRTGPTPFATAPMPGGQNLPAPATGMPGIANFGGGMPGGMPPPPAPTGPGMMAQGPPGVARPMAFGGSYQGYTAGVPGIAGGQPAPYTGELHNDFHLSNAVSTMLGIPNQWHAPDGSPGGGGMPQGDVAQAASMALATAPKGGGPGGPTAAQGVPPGWTPGPGGSLLGALPSNVPPPSPALAGMAGITPPAGAPTTLPTYPGGAPPKKMQAGGYVRGYADGGSVDNQQPSEVRRGTLSVPSQGSSQPQSQVDAKTTINNLSRDLSNMYGGQAPGSQPPAAPGGWRPGTPYGGTGAPVQSGTPGQIPGLPANAQPNAALGMGLNPNAGLPVGGSGYLYAPGQPVGPTPGTGSQVTPQGAQMGNAIGGAISSIGGAFQQALNQTANTPWQWRPNAIPAPQQGPPTPQLQQERVT